MNEVVAAIAVATFFVVNFQLTLSWGGAIIYSS